MNNLKIRTKEQAIEWIHSLKTLGIKPGLSRMEWMLEKLGNPERSLKFIHVAGTNGKGSTLSFISQVLKKSGYRVGTYTSPYLINFTNRIQVNGEDISGDDLVDILNQVIPLAKELENTEIGAPTEFEIVTVIAFQYFAKKTYPDIVVMETGLGGRLDSTNVVYPLVSVITNVGYDHMNILGYDIKEIANEKAGIIKQGIPVVSAVENEDAKNVIEDTAQLKKSKLYQINEQFNLETHKMNNNISQFDFKGPFLTMPDIVIKMLGPHQVKNAGTALMTLEILRQYYAFYIDEEAVYSGMKSTFWPGRFEVLSDKPTVIIDGAHNPEGATSLKETLSLFDYKRLILLTGILEDKSINDFYKILLPVADELIITQPEFHRAAAVEKVSEIIRTIEPKKEFIIIKDWNEALDKVLRIANSDDLVVITGSLYMISDVRRSLIKKLKEIVI